MTTVWNLGRLRYAVRKISGKIDPTQMPDSSISTIPIGPTNPPGIDDYINDFYLYDFDEQLRTLELKDYYYFNTIPNVGTYNLPVNYFTAEGPIYVDGYQISWYQSPDIFFRIWPLLNNVDHAIVTTTGMTSTYTFTCSQTPIQQGTVSIGTNPAPAGGPALETFYDKLDNSLGQWNNPAPLYGTLGGAGTINYLTGAVSITYASAPSQGFSVNAHYYPYVASRPRDCLFYQQRFNLKPIPNDTYQIKVMAYKQPTVTLAGNTNPVNTASQFSSFSDMATFNEWWQVIAYGAALKILIEEGDHEEYARNVGYFEQAKLLAQRRALKQLSNQRIQTAYSENGGTTNAWPVYPIY